MPKYKYYYDQETLSYRRIEVNTGVRFRNAFVFLTVSALFGLIMLLVLLSSPLIETPKEIAQAREINKAHTTFIDSILRHEHKGRIHALMVVCTFLI